jgi:hypothetical protein
LLMSKFACPPVGEYCRCGVVVRPIVPSEGVMLTRIFSEVLARWSHVWAQCVRGDLFISGVCFGVEK